MTVILGLCGCVLLFLGIWGCTVTLPTKMLAKNFPEDVQEALKPRLDALPMNGKRILGWVILILFITGYILLFIIAGLDGKVHGFTYMQYFLRFLTIGVMIKVFDIVCLDYYLLTKTHFFQHYFPETEGCAGWKNFGYNRSQQIWQIIMTVIGTAVTAWIFTKL